MHDDVLMNEPPSQLDIVKALRKKARLRSAFVPGAGLALLGYRKSALLVALPSLFLLASMFAVALSPCPIGLWTFIISAGAALVAYVLEYALVGKLAPLTDAPPRRPEDLTWSACSAPWRLSPRWAL